MADVKAKIQETQGDDFPATSMNIIYQGKVRARSCTALPLLLVPTCSCTLMPALSCRCFLLITPLALLITHLSRF